MVLCAGETGIFMKVINLANIYLKLGRYVYIASVLLSEISIYGISAFSKTDDIPH